ncbi:MAG: hypothetical protein AAB603_04560, partial [Patescibacteria group bacterium]
AAELTNLGGVTATGAEINILDGVTGVTAAELTNLGGVTATGAEINALNSGTGANFDLTAYDGKVRMHSTVTVGTGIAQYNRGYVTSNLYFNGTNWITSTISGSASNEFSGIQFSNGGSLNLIAGSVATGTTSLGTSLNSYIRARAIANGDFECNTACTTNAFDLAENVLVEDTSIEPGDIVIASPTTSLPNWNQRYNAFKVVKAQTPYAQEAIGTISEKPGFLMRGYGFEEENNIDQKFVRPLSLSGRVPVKVSTINGSIKIGDAITTSNIPGVGMKATKAGYIIGRSLENYSNTDISAVGKILAIVSISWYDPDVYLTNLDDLRIINDNNSYFLTGKENSIVSRMGAFAEVVVAKIRAGLIETKKLIVDGVDILKKLNELSVKVDKQQKIIEAQQKQINELKIFIKELKNK